MSYNSYSDDSHKVSKYNEAGLQITRLHELWLKAELFSSRSLLTKWKFNLDAIWRELYADIKKSQTPTEYFSINNKLKNKIAKAKNKTILYNYLDKRHQFLKYIQDAVGKGGSYGYADEEDAE